jgi:hypothetical protein
MYTVLPPTSFTDYILVVLYICTYSSLKMPRYGSVDGPRRFKNAAEYREPKVPWALLSPWQPKYELPDPRLLGSFSASHSQTDLAIRRVRSTCGRSWVKCTSILYAMYNVRWRYIENVRPLTNHSMERCFCFLFWLFFLPFTLGPC